MSESQSNFRGMHVAALESRRAADMQRLIERHGGIPHVAPSLREVPLDENRAAVDFAHRLITGEVGITIFLTGVGFRYLLESIERHVDRGRYLNALSDTVTIARGPKPVAAMKEVGLTPTHRVPEPNTWREVLKLIDGELHIANQTIGLQEYGVTNPSLIAGLEARGGRVLGVPVYRWDLPEDCGPLEALVQAIVSGEIDVVLFTSAHQVVNLLTMSVRQKLETGLRRGLDRTIVASIGPTTSETLRDMEIRVDVEPAHSKMGQLVAAAAERSATLKRRREQLAERLSLREHEPAGNGDASTEAPWYQSRFMRACRGEPVDVTPVWLMRQAGRYMREYREVRAKTTFLELCKNPRLCSEVMCTAVSRLGVDAAIIFSDLLPILEPMGLELEFAQGEGPVIHNPVRGAGDVERVLELESIDALHFVVETVSQTRHDLPADIPLIGFAGAPFTLASYTIEGGSSRNYLHTKTLMYRDPPAWHALMDRFARAITRYLNAQIAAGAQCVQLFDSWVGCLGVDDYRKYVLPATRQIIEGITPQTPVILFGTGNPALLPSMAEAGSSILGVDWRVPLAQAWEQIGYDRAVQGNLDPTVLLADRSTVRQRARELLRQVGGRPGHIFNLGHGILPQTPVDNAIALVEAVHEGI